MAEFDTTGFSAVNDFFGGDAPKEGKTNEQTSSKLSANQGRKRRGGVGSSSAPASKNEDLLKRVLKVGKKRSRQDGDDDEDDDDENEMKGHDDDGDEEEGRTGIAPTKEKVAVIPEERTVEKRKLGKKERKRLKAEAAAAQEAQASAPNNNNDNDETAEGTSNTGEEPSTTQEEGKEGTAGVSIIKKTKTKSKRKKIRSRQKNIYKDTRSVETKPAHLILGKTFYQGRPLTEETRSKLNLPSPKERSSLFVLDRSGASESVTDDGVRLAVDDLLMEEAEDGGMSLEKPNAPTKKTKKNKKPKKKKYKNL